MRYSLLLSALICVGCATGKPIPPVRTAMLPQAGCGAELGAEAQAFRIQKTDYVVGDWVDAQQLRLLVFPEPLNAEPQQPSHGYRFELGKPGLRRMEAGRLEAEFADFRSRRRIRVKGGGELVKDALAKGLLGIDQGQPGLIRMPDGSEAEIGIVSEKPLDARPRLTFYVKGRWAGSYLAEAYRGSAESVLDALSLSPSRRYLIFGSKITDLQSTQRVAPSLSLFSETCPDLYRVIPNRDWSKAALVYIREGLIRVAVSDFDASQGWDLKP